VSEEWRGRGVQILKIIDRRTFLKASVVAGVAASAPIYFSQHSYTNANKNDVIEKIPTNCNGCSSQCGIYVTLKNGRVWKAEGNSANLKSAGTLCARGNALIADAYCPNRVTQPMKRISDMEFEPISWEQAFKEIGDKLNGIINKYGGHTIAWAHHPKRGINYQNILLDYVGSPNIFTHHATCNSARSNVWARMVGGVLSGDHENTQYMVFIGRNLAGALIPNGMSKIFKAKDAGAKIIVIDPKFSEMAKIADLWVPIKPGTDLAFLLALANVLITERLYDSNFVESYVEGFDEFWESNKEYTPQWAESITGISADFIKEIAYGLADASPKALIDPSYHGLQAHYKNSVQIAQAIVIVNSLLGNIYQKGGLRPSARIAFGQLNINRPPEKEKGQRADGAGVIGKYPTVDRGLGIPQLIPQLVENGGLKAIFIYNYNPLRSGPDPEYQKKIKNADLVVCIDVAWSETPTHVAHYILPENMFLEQSELPFTTNYDIIHDKIQIAWRQKVMEPIHNTKSLLEILQGIAGQIGAQEYFDFTVEEHVEAMLRPLTSYGVTLERLREEGTVDLPFSTSVGIPMKEGQPALNTPSGKIEFSVGLYKHFGFSGVPTWIPPEVVPMGEDEFRLIHGKQPYHSHIKTINNPYLMAITKEYDSTRMWINKSRAEKLGIKDGDSVIVETPKVRKSIRVKVTELLHPDCVWLPSAYGGFSQSAKLAYGVGINYNDFLEPTIEPISGIVMTQEIIVKVRKG
jgi:thiosulfate reductase/polysulfide reductase chain A